MMISVCVLQARTGFRRPSRRRVKIDSASKCIQYITSVCWLNPRERGRFTMQRSCKISHNRTPSSRIIVDARRAAVATYERTWHHSTVRLHCLKFTQTIRNYPCIIVLKTRTAICLRRCFGKFCCAKHVDGKPYTENLTRWSTRTCVVTLLPNARKSRKRWDSHSIMPKRLARFVTATLECPTPSEDHLIFRLRKPNMPRFCARGACRGHPKRRFCATGPA